MAQEESDQFQENEQDEEQQLQNQLENTPFETILKLRQMPMNKKDKKKQLNRNTIPFQQIKGGPVQRDARIPVSKFYKPKIKQDFRDPRFETSAGELNLTKFHKSYSFISDMKKNEIDKLSKVKGPLKQQLIPIIAKSKDEIKKSEQFQQSRQLFKSLKTKNFHPKKSLIKEKTLQQKFNQLEKEGKLDDYVKAKKKQRNIKLDNIAKKISKR